MKEKDESDALKTVPLPDGRRVYGPRRAWLFALLLLVAFSPEVSAQDVARSFEQLQLLVKAGDTVSVRDSNGTETTGRIESLSLSVMTLVGHVGKQRQFRETDVTSILQRRGDSLVNGAAWGLISGVVLFGVMLVGGCGDCDASAAAGVGIPIYGAIGVGIGVGVDALISRGQVIYERPAG